MVSLSHRRPPAASAAIAAAPAASRAQSRERMLKLGIVPAGGSRAEVQAKLPSEMKRWADGS
jgi:hypothetical protein